MDLFRPIVVFVCCFHDTSIITTTTRSRCLTININMGGKELLAQTKYFTVFEENSLVCVIYTHVLNIVYSVP